MSDFFIDNPSMSDTLNFLRGFADRCFFYGNEVDLEEKILANQINYYIIVYRPKDTDLQKTEVFGFINKDKYKLSIKIVILRESIFDFEVMDKHQYKCKKHIRKFSENYVNEMNLDIPPLIIVKIIENFISFNNTTVQIDPYITNPELYVCDSCNFNQILESHKHCAGCGKSITV
jgi:hypothetical protein